MYDVLCRDGTWPLTWLWYLIPRGLLLWNLLAAVPRCPCWSRDSRERKPLTSLGRPPPWPWLEIQWGGLASSVSGTDQVWEIVNNDGLNGLLWWRSDGGNYASDEPLDLWWKPSLQSWLWVWQEQSDPSLDLTTTSSLIKNSYSPQIFS